MAEPDSTGSKVKAFNGLPKPCFGISTSRPWLKAISMAIAVESSKRNLRSLAGPVRYRRGVLRLLMNVNVSRASCPDLVANA